MQKNLLSLQNHFKKITMNTVKFETGATTHAVNDLILYTDNTRKLAELRDRIFSMYAHINECPTPEELKKLFDAAKLRYIKELGWKNSAHIANMKEEQESEYCTLYASEFPDWKKEHSIQG